MSFESYKRERLAKFVDKKQNLYGILARMVATLIFLPLGIFLFAEYSNSIFPNIKVWVSSVILLAMLVVGFRYLISLSDKFGEFRLTKKERTLHLLCRCVDSIDEQIKGNKKRFKKSRRLLLSIKNILDLTNFEVFGTEAEKEANSFFENLATYIDIEIFPKLRLDASNEILRRIQNEIVFIFEALDSDNYLKLKQKINEISKEYEKKEKPSIFERLNLDKKKLQGLYFSIALIIASFFTYYIISSLLFKRPFSFYESSFFSLTFPIAIIYGMKILSSIRSN